MDSFYLLKNLVHYFLHLIFPIFLAKIFYKEKWRKASFLLLATMLVDLDHLLATPIFNPNRCSINFHPLHSYYAIGVYFLGFIFLKGNYRIISLGLLLHMFTDWQDCYLWRF
ncbi:MAG: DUF6122 family protein [Flavobacteriaceae bacterium]|nr:DUF6122 family protein [Flavobacteriaceae bacterium]